jgi:outer membrane protein TolC
MNLKPSIKNPIAAALLSGLFLSSAYGQLTIEACHEKARERYPLARQYSLIGSAEALDLELARRGYLPRITLSGKASYQSDVTSLESLASSLPPTMASALAGSGASKDQYQALVEVTQNLWDGGAVRAQIKGIESSSQIELRKLDVDLYALNDRVDQLFFGILSVKEQLKQNSVLAGELEANFSRVRAGVDNGVANRSDLDAVRVEMLTTRQKAIDLTAAAKSNREMLAALIGESIPEDEEFSMPEASEPLPRGSGERRPEMGLFDAQKKALDAQAAAVRAATMPRLSVFLQAAYGDPGLNMFKPGFAPYWIGGLKLAWSLNALIDSRDQLGKIEQARATIEAQREAFLLNNGMQADRIANDIGRLRELLSIDDELIALREGMRKSTEGKLDFGAATTDDVLKAIDAESLARQGKSLHEVQLAMAVYALKNASNE